MMWVAPTVVACLLSFTQATISVDYGHGDESIQRTFKNAGDAYKILGKETFQALGIMMFSQYLQKCTYEIQVERVRRITEFAENCSTGILTEECAKPMSAVALDEMCRTPLNAEKYPFHAECCTKKDPDRNKCFLSHKIADLEDLPAYKDREPEEMCQQFKNDRLSYMARYLHDLTGRHSFVHAARVLSLAGQFENIADACCQDVSAIKQCFAEKMPGHVKELLLLSAIQKKMCYLLDRYERGLLQEIMFIRLSQKYPKASLEEIQEMSNDVANTHVDCCHGNMMQCMIDHMEVLSKMCAKKDTISSKLTHCCAKDLYEKSECIIRLENDDKPADVSPHVLELIKNRDVCNYTLEQRRLSLTRLSHEYSRRHPELSTQLLKRITDQLNLVLSLYCLLGEHPESLKKLDDLMKLLGDSQTFVKKSCDDLQNMGDYNFHNELLIGWTKKMPQLPTASLIDLTQNIVNFETECCKKDETMKMPCLEGRFDFLIADICRKHHGRSTNSVVKECCSDLYSGWRPCFTSANIDRMYVPPEFTPDQFKFSSDLCTVTSPLDLRIKKQTFLVQLVKHKPTIEEEQLKPIIAEFLAMMDHCCKSDDHQKCFDERGPKLFELSRNVLDPKAKVEVAAAV